MLVRVWHELVVKGRSVVRRVRPSIAVQRLRTIRAFVARFATKIAAIALLASLLRLLLEDVCLKTLTVFKTVNVTQSLL